MESVTVIDGVLIDPIVSKINDNVPVTVLEQISSNIGAIKDYIKDKQGDSGKLDCAACKSISVALDELYDDIQYWWF